MTKVAIIESKLFWGTKVDEVKEFPTYEDAVAFCTEFNKQNDKDYVLDWYMYAEIV